MRSIRRFCTSLCVSLAAAAAFGTTAWAASFPDVEGHWASETVEWGVEAGAINGYPDGKFRPDGNVTEAEFLAMLLKLYDPKGVQDPAETLHWSDKFYHFAVQYNYPVQGASSPALRDVPIVRESVAEIVAGAMGYNYLDDNAIKFVITRQIALGKIVGELSVESFQGSDTLTRAEAMQFIRNMTERGVTELKFRPAEPSPVDDSLEILPEETLALRTIEETLKQDVLPNYEGYSIGNNSTDTVHLTDSQGNRAVSVVYDAVDQKRLRQVWVEDTRNEEFMTLLSDVLRAFGISVDDAFKDNIKRADEQNEIIEMTVGDQKLSIEPSTRLKYIVGVYIE